MWNQVYNPLSNTALSTIAAAIPVVTLLVLIASGKVKAHIAAIIAVILTNLIAIFIFSMPPGMSNRWRDGCFRTWGCCSCRLESVSSLKAV